VADAAQGVFNLRSDEATYCSCVTLFNLSKLEDCSSLAGTAAVPLLVEVLSRGPILCMQLATAALCNLSVRDEFHDQVGMLPLHVFDDGVTLVRAWQLHSIALSGMIKIISAAHLDIAIKLVRFLSSFLSFSFFAHSHFYSSI